MKASPGAVNSATGLEAAAAAAAAFPVQGEVLAMPLVGVGCTVAGAILLHVNPLAPLSRRAERAR